MISPLHIIRLFGIFSADNRVSYVVEGVGVSGWIILEEISSHCSEAQKRWRGHSSELKRSTSVDLSTVGEQGKRGWDEGDLGLRWWGQKMQH